jgi:hypothetical protein
MSSVLFKRNQHTHQRFMFRTVQQTEQHEIVRDMLTVAIRLNIQDSYIHIAHRGRLFSLWEAK